MSSSSYHLIAIFPRMMDAPRPAWPMDVLERVRAIPDVVDATFPDLSASWLAASGEEADVRRESRRRFIEVYVSAKTPAAGAGAVDRVRECIKVIRAEVDPEQAVTFAITPLEAVERL